ncbi:MAG TPA: Smr/MutS family protein [Candidatus Kapabacteria bacterium]|nr:Smr/MutS family protein [Candidatus Kapabacteria bacterium]
MKIIDLHTTETITDALFLLEQELFHAYQGKETTCHVIHGIGTGMLARAVHEALNKNPMVRSWVEAEDGGSCMVTI